MLTNLRTDPGWKEQLWEGSPDQEPFRRHAEGSGEEREFR